METNRDNSFRLANSQDTIHDNVISGNEIIGRTISRGVISSGQITMIDYEPTNAIEFSTGQQTPVLQFRPNGDIYIQGRLAANDMEVVEGMRRLLSGRGLL